MCNKTAFTFNNPLLKFLEQMSVKGKQLIIILLK